MTKDNHKLGQFDLNGIPPAPRGTPQIEVTFEVDANGILNVAAEDKGTGKKEKITITAEKGRLSQEDIERMVKEAEEFAEQDKAVKAKIDSRNQLETYCYNMKSTVEDKAKDKISDDDKETITAAVKEALEWLEENQDAGARRACGQVARGCGGNADGFATTHARVCVRCLACMRPAFQGAANK